LILGVAFLIAVGTLALFRLWPVARSERRAHIEIILPVSSHPWKENPLWQVTRDTAPE